MADKKKQEDKQQEEEPKYEGAGLEEVKQAVKKNEPLKFDKEKSRARRFMKDAAKFELTRPVMTRVRNRIKEIKEFSQAETITVKKGNRRHHKTFNPQYHIAGLDAQVSNGVGRITYMLYAQDENGNKMKKVNKGKHPHDPNREIDLDVQYEIAKTVVETIEKNKPLKVEYLEEDELFDE